MRRVNTGTLLAMGLLAAGFYYFGIFRSRKSYLRWERFKKVPDSAYGYAQAEPEEAPSQEMYL